VRKSVASPARDVDRGRLDVPRETLLSWQSAQRETAAMPTRWYVSLDPEGMAGGTGWLYVVVRAQTGVIYQQQYGGTACRQGQAEGFLVPVFGPGA
jgi:Family of unknown function (DUF6210)